jgi:hypothetical protein
LSQPTGLLASITQKNLFLSAVVNSANKVYDASRAAAVQMSSNDIIAGDSLSINYASASFDNKNVGNAKTVTIGGINISGTDANNYFLQNTFTTTNANITQKALSVSGVSAANKVYDASTAAALSGGVLIGGATSTTDNKTYTGDTIVLATSTVGAFTDKNVGNAKAISTTGFAISGIDAANYSLSQPSYLAANITQKAITVSGVTAANKVYDATTAATLSGGLLTSGAASTTDNKTYTGDTIVLATSTVGAFTDKIVGNAKTVTTTGFSISGTDALNYSLAQPSYVTANIT